MKFPKKLDNEKGAVLIISMFVLTVIFGLTACFSMASVGELRASNRYQNSAEAFWAAEAAINRFIQNTALLDEGGLSLTIGGVDVDLSKDDESDPQFRIVTATATADGTERTLEVQFAAGTAAIWENTASTGGNFTYDDIGVTSLDIDGLTRISGSYSGDESGINDLQESVDSNLTTISYPDVDGNSTPDEFNDFREYYRHMTDVDDPDFTGEYTADEVLYIPSPDTLEFTPESELNGRKVIFVDGGTPGEGHAAIHFNSNWIADQNVTVVATGAVVFVQPLDDAVDNSKLNAVSWSDYVELSAFDSGHRGTIYTHSQANIIYGGWFATSTTHGSIIANEGTWVGLGGLGIEKAYEYVDPIDEEGLVPPGFQGLISGGSTGYASVPSSWTEI